MNWGKYQTALAVSPKDPSMKTMHWLFAVVFSMTILPGVSNAEDKREAKPRFKGVELYSWKTPAGDWLFVLLDGTNRQKDEKEVKEAKTQIKGVKDLKKALALLAEGEMVIWSKHRLQGFEFPPEGTRKEIEKLAKDIKVELVIDVE